MATTIKALEMMEKKDTDIDCYFEREIGKDLIVDDAEEGDDCCQRGDAREETYNTKPLIL